MLIAPGSSSSPTQIPVFDEPRSRDVGANYALIAILVGLFVFTIVAGMGLASGSIPLERSCLLMALPPFCLAIWQLYGFTRETRSRDSGLLVGAAGWLCVVLALLVQQSAINTALQQGTSVSTIQTPALATFLGFGAAFLIALGAFLSFSHWRGLLAARNSL